MTYTTPRTWAPGERGITAEVFNVHIAQNLQDIFNRATNLSGTYKDIATVTVPSVRAEIARMSVNSRYGSLLLTIVGNWTGASTLYYNVVGVRSEEIFTGAAGTEIAKQWIIPHLPTGLLNVIIQAQGAGQILSFQADVRELI